MEKLFIIVITMAFISGFCVITYAQDINALDHNNGFQNYKFGMHKDNFKDCSWTFVVRDRFYQFETVDTRGEDVERCTISRTHSINDIEVSGVVLFFIDSKLSKIRVNLKQSSSIIHALSSAFGHPSNITSPNAEYITTATGQKIRNPHRNLNASKSTVRTWNGNEVTLTYRSGYSQPIGDVIPTLEFKVRDYDRRLKEYRKIRYSPSDF